MLLRSNTKLEKKYGEASKYLLSGLTLAPNSLSGHNVCEAATAGCIAACVLWFAGRRVTDVARNRAKLDTQWFFEDRESFELQLHKDVKRLQRKARKEGLKLAIRLNVASDLDWSEFIAQHPDVTFYDYTKVRSRFEAYLNGNLPPNWHLTFSANERTTDAQLASYLQRGGNVAMVYDIEYKSMGSAGWAKGDIPTSVKIGGIDFDTFDADLHDVRLPDVDGRGRAGILRLKGTNKAKQRAIATGFARGQKTMVASVENGDIVWSKVSA